MRHHRVHRSFFQIMIKSFCVALAIVCLSCGPVLAGDAEAVANPATQAGRLQAEFSRAKSTDERRAVAEALLALGKDGGRRLHGAARGEFLKRLPRSSAGYQRTAAKVLEGRLGTGKAGEIDSLRKTIRDVAATAELSKELIEQKSDPALARLEVLLVVTSAQVLEADSELAAARAELLELADWAERAAALVPEKDRGKLPPLPGKAGVAAEFAAADALAALMAAPLTPADRQTLSANVQLAAQLDPEEARGIQRLNQIRFLVGLPAQMIDLKLVTACRVHSEDMATKDFFAHESPVAGRENPWKRAAAAGTSASAENIFMGMPDGEAAIEGWWHSPGHHKNMLGGQRRTGLGRSGERWTQLFGD